MTARPARRHAFTMMLHPGRAAEYKARHDALWPELAMLLKDAGISNYSIFLDEETHLLFGYLELAEGHGLDDLPAAPIMRRWWAFMRDIMRTHEDGAPVAVPLSEVFHLA